MAKVNGGEFTVTVNHEELAALTSALGGHIDMVEPMLTDPQMMVPADELAHSRRELAVVKELWLAFRKAQGK